MKSAMVVFICLFYLFSTRLTADTLNVYTPNSIFLAYDADYETMAHPYQFVKNITKERTFYEKLKVKQCNKFIIDTAKDNTVNKGSLDTYQFDTEGRLIKSLYMVKNDFFNEKTFKYVNENIFEITETIKSPYENSISKTSFFYDKDNLLTKSKEYRDDKSSGEINYLYDNSTILTAKKEESSIGPDPNSSITKDYHYTYNSDNRISEIKMYFGENYYNTVYFEYNFYGNIKKITDKVSDGHMVEVEFSYNQQGLLEQKVVTISDYKDPRFPKSSEYFIYEYEFYK
jgi:hypothetical protein